MNHVSQLPNNPAAAAAAATTTTTVLRPFVRDYPGEPVPEETFTHSPSWSLPNLYQLLPSTTIHSILPVQFTCLTLFARPLSMSSLVYLLVWSPPPHIPYISSPNHCLLFAAHAHTIAACFALVPRLYHLFLVSFSTLYLGLYSVLLSAVCLYFSYATNLCPVDVYNCIFTTVYISIVWLRFVNSY